MIAAVLGTLSFVFQNICCKEYGRRFPNTLHPQLTMIVLSISLVAAIMAALGGVQLLTPMGYLLTLAFGLFFVPEPAAALSRILVPRASMARRCSSVHCMVSSPGVVMDLW